MILVILISDLLFATDHENQGAFYWQRNRARHLKKYEFIFLTCIKFIKIVIIQMDFMMQELSLINVYIC